MQVARLIFAGSIAIGRRTDAAGAGENANLNQASPRPEDEDKQAPPRRVLPRLLEGG